MQRFSTDKKSLCNDIKVYIYVCDNFMINKKLIINCLKAYTEQG